MTLELILGLILLYLGAEALIRSAGSISLKFGLSPLVIGLVIMGYGTAMPELFVTVEASIHGHGGLAVGNIVGSNIFNLGGVFGVALLFKNISIKPIIKNFDIPVLIVTTLILFGFAYYGSLPRVAAFCLLLLLIFYTYKAIKEGKKQFHHENTLIDRKEFNLPLKISCPLLLIAFICLIGGSSLFVQGAVHLTTALDVNEGLIGITVVAIATAIPELLTTCIALIKKHEDIAIGNILGSNIFNVLGICGSAGLVAPLDINSVAFSDYLVMIAITVLFTLIILYYKTIPRKVGFLFISSYITYVLYLTRWA
jgi:cation:H+ antiporter